MVCNNGQIWAFNSQRWCAREKKTDGRNAQMKTDGQKNHAEITLNVIQQFDAKQLQIKYSQVSTNNPQT